MSHLFLSRPQPDARAYPGEERPHRTEILPIFVTSGSDLIARSLVALNVAIGLALRGTRTVIVDADPAAPTVRILAGGVAESIDGRTRLPLGGGLAVQIVGSVRETEIEARSVIVNSPASRWIEGGPVGGVRNVLLLVTSPSPRECLHGFAIVKRAAADDAGLRLGIVVADVVDEEDGRSFFEKLAVLLARHASVFATYCGWLSAGDRIGRSVRERVPALLTLAEPQLCDRLRRITAALEALAGSDKVGGDAMHEGASYRRLGLSDREAADVLRIVRESSSAGRV